MENKSETVPSSASQTASPSVWLASLGWIIAAGVVVWFFVIAGPAEREAGLTTGMTEQNQQDRAIYEAAFGTPTTPFPLSDVVNVRVLRLQPGSIATEQLIFGTNPFSEQPKQQLVIYDDATRIVRRVVVPPEEFERRINAAREAGENPMLIPPFDDMPATVENINPGDRLEVIARDPQALNSDSFMADFIAIVVEPVISNPTTAR